MPRSQKAKNLKKKRKTYLKTLLRPSNNVLVLLGMKGLDL